VPAGTGRAAPLSGAGRAVAIVRASLPQRILWRLEYAAVRGAELLLQLLPPDGAVAFARGLGRAWWRLDASRRRTTLENLRVAMGDRLDEAARRALGVRAAEHAFTLLAEIVSRRRAIPDLRAFRARTTATGDVEALRADIRAGTGGILLTAHLGNWETAGAYLGYEDVPFTAIARSVPNPWVQAHLMGTRRASFEVQEKVGAVRRTVDAIRAGRWVAMLGDQNAGSHGVFAPFFGIPASTYPLPATLAVRHRFRVYFAAALRRGPRHRYEMRVRRYDAPEGLDHREAELHLLGAYHATLEAWIRESPEQYVWMHRRWKTRPAGEVPGPHLPSYDHRGPRRRPRPVLA
jgi:KDO2-lipid IV(A) lauroyltransferase